MSERIRVTADTEEMVTADDALKLADEAKWMATFVTPDRGAWSRVQGTLRRASIALRAFVGYRAQACEGLVDACSERDSLVIENAELAGKLADVELRRSVADDARAWAQDAIAAVNGQGPLRQEWHDNPANVVRNLCTVLLTVAAECEGWKTQALAGYVQATDAFGRPILVAAVRDDSAPLDG